MGVRMLATQTKIKDGNLAIDFDLFSVFLSTEQLIQVQVCTSGMNPKHVINSYASSAC